MAAAVASSAKEGVPRTVPRTQTKELSKGTVPKEQVVEYLKSAGFEQDPNHSRDLLATSSEDSFH